MRSTITTVADSSSDTSQSSVWRKLLDDTNAILSDNQVPEESTDPLPDIDTTPVIEQYKGMTISKLCTLLSAVISGKLHFRTLLSSLTNEDINFINKNTLGSLSSIGIDVNLTDGGKKIMLSQNDVQLSLDREDLQKKVNYVLDEHLNNKPVEKPKPSPKPVYQGNLNAYEIRLNILKEAISLSNGSYTLALSIAEDLYKFVEGNKSRRQS
jgi:hypothetical protein